MEWNDLQAHRENYPDLMGHVQVEPSFDGETLQLGKLDPRMTAKGKCDLNNVGHSARPDISKLVVDTSVRQAVAFGMENARPMLTEAAPENTEAGDGSNRE